MTKVTKICDEKAGLFGFIEGPTKPVGVVIFSHGVLSGVMESQRFSHIKILLHKNNIATVGTYLPSHGPRKNEAFTLKQSIKTLESTMDFITSRFSETPIGYLGISVGSSLIAYLAQKYIEKLSSVALISLITDFTIFRGYHFGWKHYRRWKTYGYSQSDALSLFETLVSDSVSKYGNIDIHRKIMSICKPKILIHGLNDRVTSYRDIVSCVDNHTALTIFPGIEGTHDIKGHCLDTASKICCNHFLHHFSIANNN